MKQQVSPVLVVVVLLVVVAGLFFWFHKTSAVGSSSGVDRAIEEGKKMRIGGPSTPGMLGGPNASATPGAPAGQPGR